MVIEVTVIWKFLFWSVPKGELTKSLLQGEWSKDLGRKDALNGATSQSWIGYAESAQINSPGSNSLSCSCVAQVSLKAVESCCKPGRPTLKSTIHMNGSFKIWKGEISQELLYR